jgi:MYXO-CTERM domain-containing protein
VATRPSGALIQQVLREITTVALYLAIVLLALLLGLGKGIPGQGREVILIWETAAGLGIAHLFVVRLSAVVASGGRLDAEELWVDLAVGVAVAAIAGVATLPYVVWTDTGDAGTAAGVWLMGLIGVAAYAGTRRAGASRLRSLLLAALGLVSAASVVFIKYSISH